MSRVKNKSPPDDTGDDGERYKAPDGPRRDHPRAQLHFWHVRRHWVPHRPIGGHGFFRSSLTSAVFEGLPPPIPVAVQANYGANRNPRVHTVRALDEALFWDANK